MKKLTGEFWIVVSPKTGKPQTYNGNWGKAFDHFLTRKTAEGCASDGHARKQAVRRVKVTTEFLD